MNTSTFSMDPIFPKWDLLCTARRGARISSREQSDALFVRELLAMGKELEISIQKVDEWIADVSDCKLLSKPEVEALCEKVGLFHGANA